MSLSLQASRSPTANAANPLDKFLHPEPMAACRSPEPKRNARKFVVPLIWFLGVLYFGAAPRAAPPPDADGRYRDWFESLMVPGSPGSPCCTAADCRMVEARWNAETRHYEARVVRENFSNGLRHPILTQQDDEAAKAARDAWLKWWAARFGDTSEVWVEVPDSTVNPVPNPTGRAVLCWSVLNTKANGVYCFMPFLGAFHDRGVQARTYA